MRSFCFKGDALEYGQLAVWKRRRDAARADGKVLNVMCDVRYIQHIHSKAASIGNPSCQHSVKKKQTRRRKVNI